MKRILTIMAACVLANSLIAGDKRLDDRFDRAWLGLPGASADNDKDYAGNGRWSERTFNRYYAQVISAGRGIGLRLEWDDPTAREYFWLYHFQNEPPTPPRVAAREAKTFWQRQP